MESLENNNKSTPVNPSVNIVSPSGLNERISQQTPKAKRKGMTALLISVVVLFVIIGVGAWFYYAQGQALMLLKQAKWDWGLENLENYQHNTSLSLEINSINNQQEDIYSMFFGGEKVNININNQQKNISSNLESDSSLIVKAGEFNLDISLKTKKIDNKFYFLIDAGDLENMLGGFIPVPDFGNTWLEINTDDIYKDMDNAYQVTIDEDNLAKVNIQFNAFLDELKDEKVFAITDLKKDLNGFRKLQLNVKEDKIETLVMLFIDHIANSYEAILEVDKNSLAYMDYRAEYTKSFEEMKSEKPEDWIQFQKMFKSISFIVLIDSKTKNIHGLELYVKDLILDAGSSSTIINGNIKYLINTIDYYDINKPDNVQTIGDIRDLYQEPKIEDDFFSDVDSDGDGLSDSMEAFYGTDINNPDSDGDGYLDGAEVDNGYNPMGEGSLEDNTPSNPEILDLETSVDVYEILEEVKALQVPTVAYSFNAQQITIGDAMATTVYTADFIPKEGIKVAIKDPDIPIMTLDVENFLEEMISYSNISVEVTDGGVGQKEFLFQGKDSSGTKELKIFIDQDKKYVTNIYVSLMDKQFAQINLRYSTKQNGYWLPNEVVIYHFADDSSVLLELSEYSFK